MPPSPEELHNAEILWKFMFLRHEPKHADVIVGLGCHDLTVADDVAALYARKVAPLIVFSGKSGRMTEAIFPQSEARIMRDKAVGHGVPEDAILIEEASTNTGQNIRFTQHLLEEKGVAVTRIVLVHKPYMLRRDFATFMCQWRGADDVEVTCWAADVSLAQYLSRTSDDDRRTLSIIVGDVQRIKLYPERGFQVEQMIPDKVWSAYEFLVARGYDTHLI